jgi:hypothetical protein
MGNTVPEWRTDQEAKYLFTVLGHTNAGEDTAQYT